MKRFLLALTAAATLAASAPARQRREAAAGHQHHAGGVRRVSLRNFSFESPWETIRVRGGRGTYRTSGETESAYAVERVEAAYGDLTGDGLDEAAVVLYFTGGGTGAFSKGFVFASRAGRLILLATFDGGDRADGGIRDVSIENRVLRVRRNEPERMNGVPVGLCCPLYLITTRYRLDGGKLVPVGEPEKTEADQDS